MFLQGVSPHQFKDGGVKKLELLAVFPDVCECHENVKTILDKLEVDAVEFSVSADIKMRELIMKIIIMI